MTRPRLIQVIRTGTLARVLVDGVELPYSIARDSVLVPVCPDDVPTVRLTLMADRVDVVNTLDEEGGGDDGGQAGDGDDHRSGAAEAAS